MTKKRKSKKQNKQKKSSIKVKLIIIFITLIVGSVFIYFNYDNIKLKQDIKKLNNAMKIIELRTKEYEYQQLLHLEDTAKLFDKIKISEARIAISFKGTIKAGYKLNNLKIQVKDGHSVIVKLNKPEILYNFIYPKSREVILDDQGIIADVDSNKIVEEIQKIREDTEKKKKQKLLEEARINGERIITKMIQKANTNINQIEFVYN
ncbi:MAG: DUF4230 domain-containing protein [Vallitalea sp.]|nr:DUF4230 domain-containing protein [Vallitalea sp.]